MEVNKDEAERCRDIGAVALRKGDKAKAIKFLSKSLQLYPLPGVEALLYQAKTTKEENNDNGESQPTSNTNRSSASTRRQQSNASESVGSDGRTYTDEQVRIVQQVLQARGGHHGHYKVLQLPKGPNSTEADIKKAYRKLSLKVHPDKNSAPHADEAFKAVGLAYATLSDAQKRHIYDQTGDEDPDNHGGGARPGMYRRGTGRDPTPEEIFNMFFGGGMPGGMGGGRGGMGGNGFHMYTTGFGPGMQFRQARPRQYQRARQQQRQGDDYDTPGLGLLLQLLPILLIAAMSFLNFNGGDVPVGSMPGEGKHFSLTHKKPFVNRLATRLSEVKEIPYFVTDRFLHSYYRNRYQLSQVELMVERAYENYLVDECKKQINYKKQLESNAKKIQDEALREQKLQSVSEFELSRCVELEDLFPRRKKGHGYR